MGAGARLQVAIWLAGVAFALWRGRLESRVVAATLLAGLVASVIFWGLDDPYRLKPYLVAADLATLATCGWAAARTKASWAVCATGFQVLSLLTYVAKAADATLLSWGYLTLAVVWGYGVLASVVVGALHRGRV